MERPLITLVFFAWAILFSFLPLLVDSQGQGKGRSVQLISPLASKSPPPPSQASNRERKKHPPPPFGRNYFLYHRSPPPGKRKNHPSKRATKMAQQKKVTANLGKKIGLLFAGIAGSLQIGVALFLGIKRWQLSKMDRHESYSS